MVAGKVQAAERAEVRQRRREVGQLIGARIESPERGSAGQAVKRAEPSYWEKPQAPIVRALTKDADVYAFHYAQSIPLDDVAPKGGSKRFPPDETPFRLTPWIAPTTLNAMMNVFLLTKSK